MRKRSFIAITVLLISIGGITIGWSSWSGKMYDYNHSDFAKQIEDLPFESKVPTKVPLKEMNVSTSNIDINQQQIVVTLSNIHKETLDVRITDNKIEYKDGLEKESVRLGGGLQGIFLPDYSGKRILTWQENDIYFEITYYYKFTPIEVSKKQLIKMAESFE
ncbi:MAG: hypothetical protein ACQEV7_17480 [Bacillota bacterium]